MTTPIDPVPNLLTVGQVCSRVPGKGGGRLNPATVTRWIVSGCPSRGGVRVRLCATRAGSRWLVTPADLDTFFKALADTRGPAPTPTTPETRTESQRREASERAARELKRRGA